MPVMTSMAYCSVSLSNDESDTLVSPRTRRRKLVSTASSAFDPRWKRTMACQMADAETEKTTAKINISTNKEELTAQGEVLKFDGFLKVYREDRDEDDLAEEEQEGMLPPLTVGQRLPLKELKATRLARLAGPRAVRRDRAHRLDAD